MKPTKQADFDVGNGRLILETGPDTLTMRTAPQIGAGERLSMPLDRAGLVAAAMLAVTPIEAREGAAPWIEDGDPQPVRRFYLGQPNDGGRDDYLRVRKSKGGYVLEKGRYEGTVFKAGSMFGVPGDVVRFVVGAMTESVE